MLEDFIEVNKLSAEIIERRVLSPAGAKSRLFVYTKDSSKWPHLFIFPARKKLDMEKVARVMGSHDIREPDEKETLRITGYQAGYLPFVSIYGVVVVLDKSLLKHDYIYTFVGEERTLKIKPDDVIEFNERAIIADVVEEDR
jgi:prolyl-tRNA editing enzyme YbaK/EbsC (Cys-tRNA(Pro) deacylase)